MSFISGKNRTAIPASEKGVANGVATLDSGGDVPAAQLGNVITLGTPTATTSGTSHDYTGIPSGTKKISIMIDGVSTSGTSVPIIQLGDSGGIETSGYKGAASALYTGTATANHSSGFAFRDAWAAANIVHGLLILTLMDTTNNTWVINGNIGYSNLAFNMVLAGSKSLTSELTQIRLTTVGGTDTFDAGSFNIQYE